MKKPNLIPIIVSGLVVAGFFTHGVIQHAQWCVFKKDFAAALPSARAELVSKHHQIASRHLSQLTREQIIDILGEPSSSSDTILNYEWLYPDGDVCKIELTFGPDDTVRVQKYHWKY